MRSLFPPVCLALALAGLAPPLWAVGPIVSSAECGPAIAEDPAAAREAAAYWSRTGGGVPARLCEAAALEAMGATATAARLLTALATNPNRAMSVGLRVVALEDGARLWLDAGAPDLASEALDRADELGPATPVRIRLRARIAGASGDWERAIGLLNERLDGEPNDAEALALRAAALRLSGDPAAAIGDADRALALDPVHPEALFEAAAARAETGDMEAAADLWLELIAARPDHPLSDLARRNLQALTLGP